MSAPRAARAPPSATASSHIDAPSIATTPYSLGVVTTQVRVGEMMSPAASPRYAAPSSRGASSTSPCGRSDVIADARVSARRLAGARQRAHARRRGAGHPSVRDNRRGFPIEASRNRTSTRIRGGMDRVESCPLEVSQARTAILVAIRPVRARRVAPRRPAEEHGVQPGSLKEIRPI